MLDRKAFDAYCVGLEGTTSIVQWGNASVWKIGGKIFAICSNWGEDVHEAISFKCSEMAYRMLIEEDGVVPAPYLARAKWVQVRTDQTLSDEDVRAYINAAYEIIAAKLTRAGRKELGIEHLAPAKKG
ncbi:MAG: hypothetical protein COB90_07605 [Hyphomicrobiales bacterium]|nr:MAG: hypothetical protein COB90_07605 [Hyphomicrobiales bacterium]